MEERIEDAIHVLRNHIPGEVPPGGMVPAQVAGGPPGNPHLVPPSHSNGPIPPNSSSYVGMHLPIQPESALVSSHKSICCKSFSKSTMWYSNLPHALKWHKMKKTMISISSLVRSTDTNITILHIDWSCEDFMSYYIIVNDKAL